MVAGLALTTSAPADARAACTTTQLTDTAEGFSRSTSISADGSRIAFISTSDFTGGNGDHSREIFLSDASDGTLTQITDTTSAVPLIHFDVSADGSHVVLSADFDPAGDNADGNNEVFLVDTTDGTTTQVTDTTGGE
ncbi:hypothetical protein B7486_74135, partial [cyanobacterium TDX16]